MTPVLSRRERWVRFIIDQWWHRNPEGYRRFCDELRASGTTLLAYVRARRAELQAQQDIDGALDAYLELEVAS